jgi:hypothetical protein
VSRPSNSTIIAEILGLEVALHGTADCLSQHRPDPPGSPRRLILRG